MKMKSLKSLFLLLIIFVMLASYIVSGLHLPMLVLFVLAVILTATVSVIFSTIFLEPIGKLSDITRKIASKKNPHTIMRKSWLEIGELERAIEEMSFDISKTFSELNSERSKFLSVIFGIKEGMLLLDNKGKVVLVNTALENIFGADMKDMVNKTAREALRNNEISDFIERSSTEIREIEEELRILTPIEGIFLAYAGPVRDEKGDSHGTICVLHDISRIRQLELFRTEFVANVSHELKTPLTAIRGTVDALLGGAIDDVENRQKFLLTLQKHAINLSSLIDDILEVSQLETRKSVKDFVAVDLSSVVEKCIDAVSEKAEKKKIKISVSLESADQIKGIEDHICRAILNVLHNAINYSNDNGRIEVNIKKNGDAVELSVTDAGIGIPPESVPRIFERFYRVDTARSKDLGGTGLGLSIVKHVMELHKGNVTVNSEVGTGSTFTLSFPQN